MKLFDLGSNSGFASELAEFNGQKPIEIEKKIFPNNEIYIRLTEDVKNDDVILAGTSYPQPNDRFMELLLAVDAAKRGGAKSIKAAITYMAYGRQDRVQREGEAVSAQATFQALLSVGLNEIYIADYHNPDTLRLIQLKAYNIRVSKALGEYVKKTYKLQEPVVILPGSKSMSEKYLIRAKEAAEGAGASYYTTLIKERDSVTGEVRTDKRKIGVQDKDVILVDDEISTGSTVINAVKMLKQENPSRIFVACTHGIFAGDSLAQIKSLGVADVITSDSIPTPLSRVHLAPLFGNKMFGGI